VEALSGPGRGPPASLPQGRQAWNGGESSSLQLSELGQGQLEDVTQDQAGQLLQATGSSSPPSLLALQFSSPSQQRAFSSPAGPHAVAAARAREAYASAAEAMQRQQLQLEGSGGDFSLEKSDSLDDWLTSEEAGDASAVGSPTLTNPSHLGREAARAAREASQHSQTQQAQTLGDELASTPHAHVEDLRDGSDFRAVFVEAPLGLTLTKHTSGVAMVTKVTAAGQAERLGVTVGDSLVGVNSQWIQGFEEAMAVLPRTPYPIAIVFRRGIRNLIGRTGSQVVKGSKVLSNPPPRPSCPLPTALHCTVPSPFFPLLLRRSSPRASCRKLASDTRTSPSFARRPI
jgi:hypothetical protein